MSDKVKTFGSVWLNSENVINVQSQRGHFPSPGLRNKKSNTNLLSRVKTAFHKNSKANSSVMLVTFYPWRNLVSSSKAKLLTEHNKCSKCTTESDKCVQRNLRTRLLSHRDIIFKSQSFLISPSVVIYTTIGDLFCPSHKWDSLVLGSPSFNNSELQYNGPITRIWI